MSTPVSRISAPRVALALGTVVVLLLVFILATASVWTSAVSALTSTRRWGRAPADAVLGDAARRGRRVRGGGGAQPAEMARSDPKRDAA
jgi:hypothetical protein